MPARLQIPFNVSILELTPAKLFNIKPVTSLDIVEGRTRQFHPEGLYSSEIFGPVGSPERSLKMSYINIRIKVFHPFIYKTLEKIRGLYTDILRGNTYAIWDDSISDFKVSDKNNPEAKTGYEFFLKHWENIEYHETNSDERKDSIALIKKFQKKALTDKVVVIPAGLRDIEDNGGRFVEDDMNNFYKKLLSISNSISDSTVRNNPEVVNGQRNSLQREFNALFEHLLAMVEGKKKLMMSKWAARRVFDTTRNVITAMDASVKDLDDPYAPDFNSTIVGMYQAMKALRPVVVFHIKNGFLSKIFLDQSQPVKLINKKTLQQDPIMLGNEYFDRWMTEEGIEKILSTFGDERIRHNHIEIAGRYLGLLYVGPDKTFKIISGIEELPSPEMKKYVRPLSLIELLYISIYKHVYKYPAYVTRYPIAGMGSKYPSITYVKTTIRSDPRTELDDTWQKQEDGYAREFPLTGDSFVNSLIPSVARIGGLGADYDGDTSSFNAVFTDECMKEVTDYLSTKNAYIGTDGKLMASVNVDTVGFVVHNLLTDM